MRAICIQIYTQFFTVEAKDELEAIELVKNGEVPLTYERFEEVDDFHPTHAYITRDNTDLHATLAPCTAYVVPQTTQTTQTTQQKTNTPTLASVA